MTKTILPSGRLPHWLSDAEAERLPEPLAGLVVEREGWSAASWAGYLRERAGRCGEELAERFRRAAELLEHGPMTAPLAGIATAPLREPPETYPGAGVSGHGIGG